MGMGGGEGDLRDSLVFPGASPGSFVGSTYWLKSVFISR